MTSVRFFPLLALCLSAAACGPAAEPAAPDPTALVTTVIAATATAGDSWTLYGQAEPDPASGQNLTAPLEAEVTGIHVAIGQAVGPGTLIATLRPSPASRLEIDRLTREAAATQVEAQRLERLRADGLASDTEVAAARAAAGTAEEGRRSLGGRAGALTLRAGRAGTVDALPAAVGDLLPAGGPVAKISRAGPLRVRLGVNPADLAGLHPGQVVTLSPISPDGRSFVGTIQSLDRRVDPASRMAGVLVVVPAASGLLAGEPIKALVPRGQTSGALSIPHAALLYDGDAPYVMVVVGGKAAKREITLVSDDGEQAQVTGALRPGEAVVVEGGAVLEEGMAVRLARTGPRLLTDTVP
ncbi:MAG: efflux transporter periplasmic adaptor subunit [Caulobacter sp.]|nr:efflux transporter periplasmic adaptor subunit [Caulobacter sp.]